MPRSHHLLALALSLAACSGSERSDSVSPPSRGSAPSPSPSESTESESTESESTESGSSSQPGASLGSVLGAAARPAPPAPSSPAAAPPATSPPAPPPAPAAPPRPDDFVDVTTIIPDAVLDLRYATEHNFTKKQLYPVARCLLRRAVAERLAAAAERLRAQDRRILLWDCYRPTSVQLDLWKLVPDPRYVAEPKFSADGKPIGGSRHCRGAAVDISLAALDGSPIPMPTDHDDFSAAAAPKRAFASKPHGAEAKRLSAAMTAAGFTIMPTEWWHFDAPDSAQFPFSDEPLGD